MMPPRNIGASNLDSLRRYIEDGTPTGSFLRSVLSNDLRAACERADSENRYLLWDIVCWIYNEAPAACWGSPETVDAWIEFHARCREPGGIST